MALVPDKVAALRDQIDTMNANLAKIRNTLTNVTSTTTSDTCMSSMVASPPLSLGDGATKGGGSSSGDDDELLSQLSSLPAARLLRGSNGNGKEASAFLVEIEFNLASCELFDDFVKSGLKPHTLTTAPQLIVPANVGEIVASRLNTHDLNALCRIESIVATPVVVSHLKREHNLSRAYKLIGTSELQMAESKLLGQIESDEMKLADELDKINKYRVCHYIFFFFCSLLWYILCI